MALNAPNECWLEARDDSQLNRANDLFRSLPLPTSLFRLNFAFKFLYQGREIVHIEKFRNSAYLL